jgi:uncharacterized protein (TIGR00299 family) protein
MSGDHDRRSAPAAPPHSDPAHGHAHGVHGHSHGAGPAAEPALAAYPFRPLPPSAPLPGDLAPLERGSGRGKLLFLDCPSGISGDMTLSALVDLGVPRSVLDQSIVELGLEHEATLTIERGHAGVIFATRVRVQVAENPPARTYAAIHALIESSRLSAAAIERALAVFARLAEAEATVHGVAQSEVTFHEVGATDSIVDIVCAVAAFDFLGANLLASPLPIGRGFARTQHGRLPLPAPATLLCLRGVPTVSDALEFELVTPTGAALVSTLAGQFVSWPALIPERVGWGAGTMEFPDRPNVLRAVLGTPSEGPGTSDRVVQFEANVDDMTGEVLAHALARLLERGALDAWLVPITMKKGRPAFTLCALAAPERTSAIEAVYFEETTTLGVRRREALRTTLTRDVVEVPTRFGPVPVKRGGSPPYQFKPEFDACVALAKQHGVPVRVVLEEALSQARSSR